MILDTLGLNEICSRDSCHFGVTFPDVACLLLVDKDKRKAVLREENSTLS
jgi:hypothetical protein